MTVSERKSGSTLVVDSDALESADAQTGDDLVRFFFALPRDARAEFARLADLDRRFGEDVGAEERERAAQEGATKR